ncbi:hypothetical protein [Streptomyces cacaoi]|uniref:hypothetical protein n=1 Tax=Streptomyces cacaoi TaxID=1898 RepID=UPI0026076180|nr:hypothetical protein [Streptomyces cacaoi]
MTTLAPRRCRSCGRRLRAPSSDGYGPVCRRALQPLTSRWTVAVPDVPPAAVPGQLPLPDH